MTQFSSMNWIRKDPTDTQNKASCVGTDPNRNWDYEWNRRTDVEQAAGEQAFQTDCSEFYAGPRPFSEPETKAVSTFLMENHKDIDVRHSSWEYWISE